MWTTISSLQTATAQILPPQDIQLDMLTLDLRGPHLDKYSKHDTNYSRYNAYQRLHPAELLLEHLMICNFFFMCPHVCIAIVQPWIHGLSHLLHNILNHLQGAFNIWRAHQEREAASYFTLKIMRITIPLQLNTQKEKLGPKTAHYSYPFRATGIATLVCVVTYPNWHLQPTVTPYVIHDIVTAFAIGAIGGCRHSQHKMRK